MITTYPYSGEKGRHDTARAKKAPAAAEARPEPADQYKRHRQTEAEIVEAVKNPSPNFRGKYAGPEQTAAVKRESLRNNIQFTIQSLEQVKRGKVDLSDPIQIIEQAEVFLSACYKAGVVPTFDRFVSSMGYSRQWVHSYRRDHAGQASVVALDNIHAHFTDIMAAEALERNFSEALTIFLLKNSQGQEYTDKVEFDNTIRAYREIPSRKQLEAQMALLDLDDRKADPEGILDGWPMTAEEFEKQRGIVEE